MAERNRRYREFRPTNVFIQAATFFWLIFLQLSCFSAIVEGKKNEKRKFNIKDLLPSFKLTYGGHNIEEIDLFPAGRKIYG